MLLLMECQPHFQSSQKIPKRFAILLAPGSRFRTVFRTLQLEILQPAHILLPEGRESIELAKDLAVITVHDNSHGHHHGPEDSLAVDLDCFPELQPTVSSIRVMEHTNALSPWRGVHPD